GLQIRDDSAATLIRLSAFFFQAEDGIRDLIVTGVQTCALPILWICPSPLGHIQATGRDARGRKQYRYHPRWRVRRDAGKFERMRSEERRVGKECRCGGWPER